MSRRSRSNNNNNSKRNGPPSSHPQEHNYEHRAFLIRSLDRNDVELAALDQLNESLHKARSKVIELCGESTLLDMGEGKLRVCQQQDGQDRLFQVKDPSHKNMNKDAIVVAACAKRAPITHLSAEQQDVCIDFLLRIKLRRRLLNRLARRLNRIAQCMDGQDVNPPMPPRYGDERLTFTSHQIQSFLHLQTRRQAAKNFIAHIKDVKREQEELREREKQQKKQREKEEKKQEKERQQETALVKEEAKANDDNDDEEKQEEAGQKDKTETQSMGSLDGEDEEVKEDAGEKDTEDEDIKKEPTENIPKEEQSEEVSVKKEEEDSGDANDDDESKDPGGSEADDSNPKAGTSSRTQNDDMMKEDQEKGADSGRDAKKGRMPPVTVSSDNVQSNAGVAKEEEEGQEVKKKNKDRSSTDNEDEGAFQLSAEQKVAVGKAYQALREYKHGYQRVCNLKTKAVSHTVILQKEAEEKEGKPRNVFHENSHGIGAAQSHMSAREKEMDLKRWQQAILQQHPDQPTFRDLGLEFVVFNLEGRRKRLAEQEQAANEEKDSNNEELNKEEPPKKRIKTHDEGSLGEKGDQNRKDKDEEDKATDEQDGGVDDVDMEEKDDNETEDEDESGTEKDIAKNDASKTEKGTDNKIGASGTEKDTDNNDASKTEKGTDEIDSLEEETNDDKDAEMTEEEDEENQDVEPETDEAAEKSGESPEKNEKKQDVDEDKDDAKDEPEEESESEEAKNATTEETMIEEDAAEGKIPAKEGVEDDEKSEKGNVSEDGDEDEKDKDSKTESVENDEDDKEDDKEEKKAEEVMMPKRMKPMSLMPVPSFYEQDLKRIRYVHADLVATSLHEHFRIKIADATAEYNRTFRMSGEVYNARTKLRESLNVAMQQHSMDISKVKNDYAMQVAIAKAHYQKRKENWEVRKAKVAMQNMLGQMPTGTPTTHQAMRHRSQIFSTVGLALGRIVDAIVLKEERSWDDGEKFEDFRPPPPPDVKNIVVNRSSGETLAQREDRLQNAAHTQVQQLNAKMQQSEENRKKAWRKLVKVKAEYEVQISGRRRIDPAQLDMIPVPPLHSSQPVQMPNIALPPSMPAPIPVYKPPAPRFLPRVQYQQQHQPQPQQQQHHHHQQQKQQEQQEQEDQMLSESKYSTARVKSRISNDGTVMPVHAPKKDKDGLYIRPAGRTRKGMSWDARRGIWVPE